jgi:nitrous oxidase accessory protein NosD
MKAVRLVTLMLSAGLSLALVPAAARAKSITVHAGDDIQAAVDAAAAGDTVKVEVGEYIYMPAGTVSAAVRITKPLKLLAKSNFKKDERVVIKPGPGQQHGILVEPPNPGDPDVIGVTIKGFTVQGFSNNGIWLRHVQKFKIQGNESIDNLENGIWPTLSANGQVYLYNQNGIVFDKKGMMYVADYVGHNMKGTTAVTVNPASATFTPFRVR